MMRTTPDMPIVSDYVLERSIRALIVVWILSGLVASAAAQEVENPLVAVPVEQAPAASLPNPIPTSIVDPELVPSIGDKRPGRVEIRGLSAIDEKEARNMILFQIRNLEEGGVTMARADDAAFFLEGGIRKLGFDKVQVDWEITTANNVLLTVREGDIYYFGDVKVSGNEQLSTGAIRELLTKVTRERLGYRIDAPSIPFVAEDLKSGVSAVKHIYALLGYAEVSVEVESVGFRSNEKIVDATLKVIEGVVRKVGNIQFLPAVDDSISAVYTAIQTEFSEKPFTAAVAASLADRIVTAANELGYYAAVIETKESRPRPATATDGGEPEMRVDVSVEGSWGERYTFGKVKIAGIEKIKEFAIDRRFKKLVGEPYSPTKVNDVVEELLKTGAFEGLLVEPVPQPDYTISLDVQTEEAKRQSLGVYAGVGTYEGPILGISYRNSSFLNLLHSLEAELEYTGRGSRGEVDYLNPWLFNTSWGLRVGMYSLTQSNEGYDILDVGLKFGLQREFGLDDRHRITLFAQPSYSSVTDFEIQEEFIGPEDYFASRAGILYSYDRRDNPQAPTKGFSADFFLSGASSAIGSETEFGRAGARMSYLLPIKKTTLKFRAQAGIIKPTDDEQLPIDLRFFSGGPRSVRSFSERDMGPHDKNGFPIGGEFSTAFSAEYEIPVAGPLSIAPFVDAGNLLFRAEDASLDNMHYAAGIGFILNSPIGPLRIDYGHNLNQSEREPAGSWHFGFGTTF